MPNIKPITRCKYLEWHLNLVSALRELNKAIVVVEDRLDKLKFNDLSCVKEDGKNI